VIPKRKAVWGRVSAYHNEHKLHEESNLKISTASFWKSNIEGFYQFRFDNTAAYTLVHVDI